MTLLYSFSGASGDSPYGKLVMDKTGNLYGTTVMGGISPCPIQQLPYYWSGTYTVIGCGTVFKIDSSGNETVLYAFTGANGDGAFPMAGLIIDAAGNLYGTTFEGGSSAACSLQPGSIGCGTVFKVDPSGHETVLYSFTGANGDGVFPEGSLVMDSAGNLYGTTYGTNDSPNISLGSSVFVLDPTGKETVLAIPCCHPYGALTMDGAGNLYGTTAEGGSATVGTVFSFTKTTPTVTVTPSASSITLVQALTVTVAVSGGSSNPTPTGSVKLTSGTYTSAATTLVSGSAPISIPAGSLPVGSDTLTVTYTPDSSSSISYNGASGSNSVTVAKAGTTVTVTPSSSSIGTAQTLSVPVVVSGGTGAPAPTGTVTLSGGGYTSSAETLSSGGYTFAIPANSLSAGTDKLTASYSGDSNYVANTGSASVTVAQSVFSMAATTPAAVNPGSGTTSTITVSTANGYAGTATITCALTSSPVGAVQLPTCSNGSSTVTLSSTTTTGTATVSVGTTAPTTAMLQPGQGRGKGWPGAGGGAILALLLFLGIPARRRSWRSLIGMLVLMVALGSTAACGGSGGGGGGGGTPIPGTSAGTYTFTVTGTGSPSITPVPTTTFTLTVN
jgi:uncharacterized repeat protein (TIGR03803 family)